MKAQRAKRMRWIAAAVALAVLIGLALYLKSVSDYQRAVSSLQIQAVDITKVADGRYVGDCDVDFIYAKVAVTVQAGKMTDIAVLKHKNDRGQAAETVLDKMVTEQTIMVDAVAGASNSSIVLKKAVENALIQAGT